MLMRILWIVCVICTVCGVFIGISLLGSAESAVQETTAIAFAVAMAVIPYVIARSVEKIRKG